MEKGEKEDNSFDPQRKENKKFLLTIDVDLIDRIVDNSKNISENSLNFMIKSLMKISKFFIIIFISKNKINLNNYIIEMN